MNLLGYLGTTGLSDVGYRFIDNTGAFIGSRQTASVFELAGARGVYGINSPTIPAGAVFVYWDSTGTASAYAYEGFDPRLPNVDTASAGALLTSGTGTAQLNVSSGAVVLVNTLTTYTGNTVQTGDSFARIGAAGAGLTALGDLRIAHLNADIDSRMATFSYTAPDNTGIAAIKSKTDSLTFTVSGFVDANIQKVNDVNVGGTGASGNEWGPG